jgi:hypothetical protein
MYIFFFLSLCLFSKTTREAMGPTQTPITWVPPAPFQGLKRLGHDIEHSRPSTAGVKNKWSYTLPLYTPSWRAQRQL